MKMDDSPILIYYKFRGNAQPIRVLCSYLYVGLNFISFQEYTKQTAKYPQQLQRILAKVNPELLPIVIHEGIVLTELYPILAYLCRRFGRADLLGRTIYERARLQEVVNKWIIKIKSTINIMFAMGNSLINCTDDEQIKRTKREAFDKIIVTSQCIPQISAYLSKYSEVQFVFGSITIIDFLYYESCFYWVGLFAELTEKLRCPINRLLMKLFSQNNGGDICFEHINKMMKFKKHFESLPFYVHNMSWLQSFPINCPMMEKKLAQTLKRLWGGDKKFFSI